VTRGFGVAETLPTQDFSLQKKKTPTTGCVLGWFTKTLRDVYMHLPAVHASKQVSNK